MEVNDKSQWRLDTHFALESLAITPSCDDGILMYRNCILVITSYRPKILKQLSFGITNQYNDTITLRIDDKGLEVINAALAANPLKILVVEAECIFTDTAVHSVHQKHYYLQSSSVYVYCSWTTRADHSLTLLPHLASEGMYVVLD